MKLLLIHPDATLPSSRIRLLQMVPHLEAAGAEVRCVEYPPGMWERRRLASEMGRFDLVLMHYRLPSFSDGIWWKSVGTPLVFDFDDAVTYRPRPRNGSHASRTRLKRFERIREVATAFSCGNRYLESLVADTGKPTCLLPSPVPLDVPRRPDVEIEGPPRIGWIGGRGNLDSLAELGDVLRKLALGHRFRLTVIADAPLEIPGCPVEHVPWTLEGQGDALARLDVGVMPLDDTPWNRGKCSYKLLQYMAAEVAAVGSPVGMNAELIDNGANGLLADGPNDWLEALLQLLDDTELRRRLARAGRETVSAGYGYETLARRWIDFFGEILGSRDATG